MDYRRCQCHLRCAATDLVTMMRIIGLEEMLLNYLCTNLSCTLLWNSTVRKATLAVKRDWHCNTTMQAVTGIGSYTVRPCWAKSFEKSTKTISRELKGGMVEHVLSDIPCFRERNTIETR